MNWIRKTTLSLGLASMVFTATAQDVKQRLSVAVERLLADSQMRHATLGLSVLNATTGEKLFEVNAQTGLAPASCQKIITSAAALDILGADYLYITELGYTGTISGGVLKGDMYLVGSGDPSLGSWRYASANESAVKKGWLQAIRPLRINRVDGKLIAHTGRFESNILPGGWIWDDMGNYYGAGISALNWHENQYDLTLRSGSTIGSNVQIVKTDPTPYKVTLTSELTAAAKGTGDNAYIYLPPGSQQGYVRGTIPVNERSFTIAGSLPDPPMQTIQLLYSFLDSLQIKIPASNVKVSNAKEVPAYRVLHRYQSPRLDSLNHWFLRRSINLYGEAFLRTIAFKQTGRGEAEAGLEQIKAFWQERGIDPAAIRMVDGSGLSPQNRVTTDALTAILQYARTRSWFTSFYDALPVFNNMKLKSGTIGGAKGFAGYHTAKDGTTYTVAIIVNNFDGPASAIVNKMYRILDELK